MERDDSLRGRGKKEKRKRRKRRQRWARGVTREKIRREPRDRGMEQEWSNQYAFTRGGQHPVSMVTDAGACATPDQRHTVIEIYLSSETSPSVYGAELPIGELRLAVSDIPRAYMYRHCVLNLLQIEMQSGSNSTFQRSLQRAQLNTERNE